MAECTYNTIGDVHDKPRAQDVTICESDLVITMECQHMVMMSDLGIQ